MFSAWVDGDHLKRMVGHFPRTWRLRYHKALFASHLSAWLLLDDFHRDDLSTLLAQDDGGLEVPGLLMADVDGDIARLSLGSRCSCSCSMKIGAPEVAALPALLPLVFDLGPVALHGGLDLEEKRESCFHIIVRNDLSQVYEHNSWNLSHQLGRFANWRIELLACTTFGKFPCYCVQRFLL